MRFTLACVGLFLSSSCALGPLDLDEITSMGPTNFSGYTQGPGELVRVRALQYGTQQWVTIAQATSAPVPTVPAGFWGGNPALYAWSVTAPITTRLDPEGRCFLSPQCWAQDEFDANAWVRLMFEVGSATSPIRAMVYDRYGLECIGRRIQGGQAFDGAAYDCRSPSYPEVRLRFNRRWGSPGPGAPAGLPTGFVGQQAVVAGVDGVTVRYHYSNVTSGWSQWRQSPGTAPVPFVTNEAPAISEMAYAIGGDGRVYRAGLTNSAPPLAAVGTLAQARSHLTAAVAPHQGDPDVVWLAYMATDGSPRVAATRDLTVLRSLALIGDDVVIARDADALTNGPATALLVAVRRLGELHFYRVVDDLPPQLLGTYAAGATGRLSNAVPLNGALHLLYTTGSQLMHASVPLRGPFAVNTRVVHAWSSGAPPDRSVLAPIGTNLFTAWTDGSVLRMARWAPGGPLGTWVEDQIDGLGPLTGPVALVPWPATVEVVARFGDGNLRMTRAALTMQLHQLERELDVFKSVANSGCASSPGAPPPPRVADPSVLLGETRAIGTALWRYPVGFTQPLLRELGIRACTSGAVQPAVPARACELAKTNVIFAPIATGYSCADGLYVRSADPEPDLVRQLGRAVGRALGVDNAGSTPTAWNATISGIPLPALQEAHALFTATLPPNCPGGQCLGLLGNAFELLGPEEAFSSALETYVDDGRYFRERAEVQRVGTPCNDILWRKYEFIRTHIYRGAEFRGAGDTSPRPSFCASAAP